MIRYTLEEVKAALLLVGFQLDIREKFMNICKGIFPDESPEKRLEAAKQSAIETSQSIELCRALIGKSNWNHVKEILSGLKGQDPEGIRRHVLGYATSVLLKSNNKKAALVLEEFIEPTYNSGFSQIVYASLSVIENS